MLTHARPLELARPLSRLSRPSSSPPTCRPLFVARPLSLSTAHASPALRPPQRALLYVPGSSHKFLTKVLSGTGLAPEAQPDVVTLDLEDSVRTELKTEARKLVTRCGPVELGRALAQTQRGGR